MTAKTRERKRPGKARVILRDAAKPPLLGMKVKDKLQGRKVF
jgi:hypothetical protein